LNDNPKICPLSMIGSRVKKCVEAHCCLWNPEVDRCLLQLYFGSIAEVNIQSIKGGDMLSEYMNEKLGADTRRDVV